MIAHMVLQGTTTPFPRERHGFYTAVRQDRLERTIDTRRHHILCAATQQ